MTNIDEIIGKKVTAKWGTGGVNFEGEVIGYMPQQTFVIRMSDGSIKHWAESLVELHKDSEEGK